MMNVVIKDKAFTKVDTYELSLKGFFMEIVTRIDKHGKMYDAYLYHEDYGIKEYMFGLLADNMPDYAYVLEVVEANLPDYISSYVEDHMDYDDVEKYLGDNENDDCACCDCHGYCPYEKEGEE